MRSMSQLLLSLLLLLSPALMFTATAGQCEFQHIGDHYACVFTPEGEQVTDIAGEHGEGLTDDDVTMLVPNSGTINNMKILNGAIVTRFPNIRVMRLYGMNLNRVEADAFDGANALEELDLSSNRLKNFTLKIASLKSLRVSDNQLANISSNMLRELSSLEALEAMSCGIANISADAFPSTLHTIDLSYNQLTAINMDAFAPTSGALRTLKLANNQIVAQTNAHRVTLAALKELDLSGNGFSIVPISGWHQLPQLESLNLAFNRITVLSSSLAETGALASLDLTNNQVDAIDRTLFHFLADLRELKLVGNLCVSMNFGNYSRVFDEALATCFDNYDGIQGWTGWQIALLVVRIVLVLVICGFIAFFIVFLITAKQKKKNSEKEALTISETQSRPEKEPIDDNPPPYGHI